ncbi:MAG: hypothetical protein KatS3mg105_3281 [Gemmatales bacterium]|nr:MAG: hypothetical protein KatS3mg105_3281 [Gemmatales bacterium]
MICHKCGEHRHTLDRDGICQWCQKFRKRCSHCGEEYHLNHFQSYLLRGKRKWRSWWPRMPSVVLQSSLQTKAEAIYGRPCGGCDGARCGDTIGRPKYCNVRPMRSTHTKQHLWQQM